MDKYHFMQSTFAEHYNIKNSDLKREVTMRLLDCLATGIVVNHSEPVQVAVNRASMLLSNSYRIS